MPTIGHDGTDEKCLAGRRILVLVQGPLDQSPRMLAHARRLAAHGASVRLLGYGQPDEAIPPGAGIETVALPGSGRDTAPTNGRALPGRNLLRTARRALAMMPRLRRALADELALADLLLAQVPPALPAVHLGVRRARRLGIPVALDWHNDGRRSRHWLLDAAIPSSRWSGEPSGRSPGRPPSISPSRRSLRAMSAVDGVVVVPDRPAAIDPAAEIPGLEFRVRRPWSPDGSRAPLDGRRQPDELEPGRGHGPAARRRGAPRHAAWRRSGPGGDGQGAGACRLRATRRNAAA